MASFSVSHWHRNKHEHYRKGKNPPGSSFLLPVCVHLSLRSPRMPLGTSQHLFYWPLLCVREQIGFYSQVRVEDKCECSITFLYKVGIIWVWMALSLSLYIDGGYLTVCMCVSGLKSHTVIFYIYLFVHKKISARVYEVYQSTRWSRFPLCCLLSHFV